MLRKLFPLLAALALMGFSGCAGPIQTIGDTLISGHDLVKLGAEAASAQCVAKTLPNDLCAKLNTSYKVFQAVWPPVDQAWLVYAKAPATDSLAATTFNAAFAVYNKDYTEILQLLTLAGVVKPGGAK